MKKFSNKFLLRTVLIGGILIFFLPQVVLAQTQTDFITGGEVCKIAKAEDGIKQQFNIPGVTQKIGQSYYVKNLGCYIIGIYRYFVGIAGILATVMIMWGGVQYVVSFGNQQKVSAAKDTITAALVGLLLAMSSYAILYFINPNLTSFDLSGIETIDPYIEGWCEERDGSQPKVEGKFNCGDVGIDKNGNDCYYHGFNCQEGTVCSVVAQNVTCLDIKDVCNELANESDFPCKTFDEQIAVSSRNSMCIDASEIYSYIKDKECRLVPVLKCDNNWLQVDCNVGNNITTKCWDSSNNGQAATIGSLTCKDERRTSNLFNAICCVERSDVDCRDKCHSDEMELNQDCQIDLGGSFDSFLGQGDACDRTRLDAGDVCCMQIKLEW